MEGSEAVYVKMIGPSGDEDEDKNGGQEAGADGIPIETSNVNVVVRVRPLNTSERFANERKIVQFPGNGGILVRSGFYS